MGHTQTTPAGSQTLRITIFALVWQVDKVNGGETKQSSNQQRGETGEGRGSTFAIFPPQRLKQKDYPGKEKG